ncbi:hypothetical protein FSPOR_10390 [Fusarium sporotrichioides]|uniref:Uncharacterized protein n=1 Tax=Fusarium sporotrichioides TaxID=5514 RepID=A0A395RM78_FUSSP|nr:hypothetical protein FSPOR_10390 [Fusarium sporotrichioides]
MDDNLVRFCGQKLTDLYKFTPQQIRQFLIDVSNDPAQFGIDATLQAQLQAVCSQVLSLCGPIGTNAAGTNYADSKLKGDKAITPEQHIYRERTLEEKRDPKPDGWSRFNINYDHDWMHKGPHFWRATNQDSVRVETLYWSHYDLLGLFLSLMGPAQEGATKKNFFVPLTAVYARWCYVIGGSGFGPSPTIHQCTWRESKGPAGGYEFFIGASLAGNNKAAASGSWDQRLKMGRFNLLSNFNNVSARTWDSKEEDPNNRPHKKKVRWHYDNSPGITDGGTMMNRFGNCGETYPFLQMLEQWSLGVRGNISGLAISKAFLDNDDMYDNLLVDKITEGKWIDWGPVGNKVRHFDVGNLWQPCINCRYLLRVAGIDNQVNFEPMTDIITNIPPDPEAPTGETS